MSGFNDTNLIEMANIVDPWHILVFWVIWDGIIGSAIVGVDPQQDIEQGLEVMCWPTLSFRTITKDFYSHERDCSCLMSSVDISCSVNKVISCVVQVN